jgi:hypothetical protein
MQIMIKNDIIERNILFLFCFVGAVLKENKDNFFMNMVAALLSLSLSLVSIL